LISQCRSKLKVRGGPFLYLVTNSFPVLDLENLVIDPDLSKKMTIFLALGIHQMGMKKSPSKITSRVMYANNPIWNEEISLDIPTSSLTRVCDTLGNIIKLNVTNRSHGY